MLHATFTLEGISDLMFGRPLGETKRDDETHDQFEMRVWQQKVGLTADGQCYLNPFCVTNALVEAAKWLGRTVDKRAGFTGRFQKGVTPGSSILLWVPNGKAPRPAKIEDVEPVKLFVPSNGKRGAGTRVPRIFPTLRSWIATGDTFIWDGKITEAQFQDHLVAVGQFMGFGAMRKGNGGINGCFRITKLEFEEVA